MDTTLTSQQVAGLRMYTTLNRLKWRGYEWTPPQVPLRNSINAKVTWIPRDSVDHLVARVCVDVIRNASEWELNDDKVIPGFMH